MFDANRRTTNNSERNPSSSGCFCTMLAEPTGRAAAVVATAATHAPGFNPSRAAAWVTATYSAALNRPVTRFKRRSSACSRCPRNALTTPTPLTPIPVPTRRRAEQVDPARIGLIGWGLGGGVVVAEASEDPRVAAVAALNCISDGTRSTRNMHDAASWQSLLTRIEADRGRRARMGRSEITDPWDIVRLDRDTRTDGYVGAELYKAPGFGSGVNLESADLLLRFSPQAMVHRLAGRPLLIVHGAENQLHRPEEAQALFDQAGEPKQLVLLAGAGHTEWMFDDHPTFGTVLGLLEEFLGSALTATSDTSPATS